MGSKLFSCGVPLIMDHLMSQQAFVLRIAPGGIDKVPEALACNEIIIGWALAKGLLDVFELYCGHGSLPPITRSIMRRR